MTERLLQYIWQFQHYNQRELQLPGGESLGILHPGTYNTHQGPDFIQARIKIDEVLFAGNIELHVKTSDWQRHRHDDDENYRNVILHVVWQHDEDKEQTIPVLSLESRVSGVLLDQYGQWMQQPTFIPCNQQAAQVSELIWKGWEDRLLAERLLHRTNIIREFQEQNNQHWEESFWWWLARHFGSKVNATAFESIARSIPVNLIAKHKTQIHQLEALLFGQSGLLNRSFEEDYPKLLSAEYRFQQKKYKLKNPFEPVFFLRMRPGNFPSIRLAQLSMLLHQSSHLFAEIKESRELKDVKKLLDVTANDYWHYHYLFDEISAYKPKHIGTQMIDNLIINAVCPALYAYGHLMNEPFYKNKALHWLEQTGPEKNAITKGFIQIGIPIQNACDSQAILELKTNYCDVKHCLDCAVGNALLKSVIR